MKTVDKLGKILLTIGRVFSSSSLIYHLLGMEVAIRHFCGGMWREAGRSEGGVVPVQYGFYPVECQPLQWFYRSSALCHSVGSCQERGTNGGKRGLVYKAGLPLE